MTAPTTAIDVDEGLRRWGAQKPQRQIDLVRDNPRFETLPGLRGAGNITAIDAASVRFDCEVDDGVTDNGSYRESATAAVTDPTGQLDRFTGSINVDELDLARLVRDVIDYAPTSG